MKTSNLQAAGALVRECLASYYMQGSRNEEMRDEKQKREMRNGKEGTSFTLQRFCQGSFIILSAITLASPSII